MSVHASGFYVNGDYLEEVNLYCPDCSWFRTWRHGPEEDAPDVTLGEINRAAIAHGRDAHGGV